MYTPSPLVTNLSAADLRRNFTLLPLKLKQAVAPGRGLTAEERLYWLEALEEHVWGLRVKRVRGLAKGLEQGDFVEVRFGSPHDPEVGKGAGVDFSSLIGRTFLAIVHRKPAQRKSITLWFHDGKIRVPLWWVRRTVSPHPLPRIHKWSDEDDSPLVPEGHPFRDPSWQVKYRNGFIETTASSFARDAYFKANPWVQAEIRKLNEDRAIALYQYLRNHWVRDEGKRATRLGLDTQTPGAWVEALWSDGGLYPVVFLGVLQTKKVGALGGEREVPDVVRVWDPEEDAIWRLSASRVKRLLVERKKVRVEGPETKPEELKINRQDRAEWSESFRDRQTQVEQKLLIQKLKSLHLTREPLASAQTLNNWVTLWGAEGGQMSKTIKRRGDRLLAWWQRWADPARKELAEEFYPVGENPLLQRLLYVPNVPLVALLTLGVRGGTEVIRAKVDLLEGIVDSEDKKLKLEVEEAIL